MTIYIVYSNSMEFTEESKDSYLMPCVQAVFNDEVQAQRYADELAHNMDSGYYCSEEYPYIKSYDVRDRHEYQDALCPPNRNVEVM